MPKKLRSTVACPSQARVICASLHFLGSGFVKGRAIGAQLSIVHSRNKCPSQRRSCQLGGRRCSTLGMVLVLVRRVILTLVLDMHGSRTRTKWIPRWRL